jgi:hypothetical protein
VAIKSTIIGHLAETAITMRFYNPNTAVMEGDLYFPLPEGATVSSYALDVKGLMVDGVAVDKDHGRQVLRNRSAQRHRPGARGVGPAETTSKPESFRFRPRERARFASVMSAR